MKRKHFGLSVVTVDDFNDPKTRIFNLTTTE